MERKLEIVTENCPQNHKCPAVDVVNVQISVLKKH